MDGKIKEMESHHVVKKLDDDTSQLEYSLMLADHAERVSDNNLESSNNADDAEPTISGESTAVQTKEEKTDASNHTESNDQE